MSTATALPINPIMSGFARLSSKDFLTRTLGVSDISQDVDKHVIEAYGLAIEDGGFDGRDVPLSHLGGEYLEYLSPNWDGEGALPIALDTLISANLFLEQVESLGVVPEICPEADGYIQFEWYIDPEHLFSVSFGPSNVISFSGINCGDCSVYGEGNVSKGFPKPVWVYIEEIISLYEELDQAA
ncbi:MAG: hypothetical protein DRR06_06535 [Gammaproteobacteria bacterium]|nr:MAG: hypothetical protein DRR06_06535 [Gammaproteobacteria bacterium]